MKKVLLIICIIMMLSGCGAENPPHKVLEEGFKFESSYHEEEPPIDEDAPWRYEVAERLYNEFCYFYDNMEEKARLEQQCEEMIVNRKPLGYNFVMAMDRYIGISMVYHKYLSEEKLDFVRQKSDVLEYARHYTNIRFGYTPSGLHFISIYYDVYDAEYIGYIKHEAINRLRGLDDEYAFLTDFSAVSKYSVADLFVEDLSGSKQDIPISFETWYDIIEEKRKENIPPNNKSKEILQYYNRIETLGAAKNNEWNLYILKIGEGIDGIYSGNEYTQMTSCWRIP